jgi:hypothetical protein
LINAIGGKVWKDEMTHSVLRNYNELGEQEFGGLRSKTSITIENIVKTYDHFDLKQ